LGRLGSLNARSRLGQGCVFRTQGIYPGHASFQFPHLRLHLLYLAGQRQRVDLGHHRSTVHRVARFQVNASHPTIHRSRHHKPILHPGFALGIHRYLQFPCSTVTRSTAVGLGRKAR
jgi:hypothetical protein